MTKPELLPLTGNPELPIDLDCPCSKQGTVWSHEPSCKIWLERIMPSARVLLFMSGSRKEWAERCAAFHAPGGIIIKVPDDYRDYVGINQMDRHPIYPMLAWINETWVWMPPDLQH